MENKEEGGDPIRPRGERRRRRRCGHGYLYSKGLIPLPNAMLPVG